MTANTPTPRKTATLKSFVTDSRLIPLLNYGLVFFMVLTLGISGILALLVANFCEDKAPDWLKSHYEFQKRTFWIGIVPVLLVAVVVLRLHITNDQLLLVLIGVPLLYTAGRASFGFNNLFNERPIANPKTWVI